MPHHPFNKARSQVKLTGLELIEVVWRPQRSQIARTFSGSLALSITQEADEIFYHIHPAARCFDISDLKHLISTTSTLLFNVRQISFGSTPYGIPNNGIHVAGQALEILPNRHVKRIDRNTGKKVDCEIIVSTNSIELDPALFQPGLCRVLRALAQNPSRHLEDLPFNWTWVNRHPFRRDLAYIEVRITGITDFTVVLRIYPDSGRSIPLNFNDKRKITESITATMERLMLLKRPKSIKQLFATLPVEIIAAIVEFMLPERLDVFQSQRRGIRMGIPWSDKSLRPGRLVLNIGHTALRKRLDLTIFGLDKRIRQIAFERARQHMPPIFPPTQ